MSAPVVRLRHHIPLAGPATREPVTGDEPYVRVSVGFTPRWFTSRLDVDLGERWHLDPSYRYDTLVVMKEHLNRTFPGVPEFRPVYDSNSVETTSATISGVLGILPIPMLYGLVPVFSADGWPDARPGGRLDRKDLDELPPPDPSAAPHIVQLLEQMDWIHGKAGKICGYLNYQGILNTALKVRGEELFVDMIEAPELTKRFLSHIATNMAQTAMVIQERQHRSGFPTGVFSVSNCVMNMISPELYEEFVLPLDYELSTMFRSFGVHTCNWDATPYVGKLRKIPRMGYLDTGAMADLARIREMFPDTRRAVLFGPVELEQMSDAELSREIRRIGTEYGPCDIALADIEDTTPDSRVVFFLETAAEVSAGFSA